MFRCAMVIVPVAGCGFRRGHAVGPDTPRDAFVPCLTRWANGTIRFGAPQALGITPRPPSIAIRFCRTTSDHLLLVGTRAHRDRLRRLLVVASDQTGTKGGPDIWQATRSSTGSSFGALDESNTPAYPNYNIYAANAL